MMGTREISGSDMTKLRKPNHDGLGVDESFIHVNIDHVGAAFDLLSAQFVGRRRGRFPNKARKFWGAGDVGSFTDHYEVEGFVYLQWLETAEVWMGVARLGRADRKSTDGFFHGADMFGGAVPQQPPQIVANFCCAKSW